MITREMVKTLQEIKRQEEKHGAAMTTKINVYQHRTTLYRCLRKLENLEAINSQTAPTSKPVKHTYTITEFGEKLIDKSINAEMIQKK